MSLEVPAECGLGVALSLQTQAPYEARTGLRGEVLFDAEGAADVLAAGSTVLLCPTIAPADTEAAAAALQRPALPPPRCPLTTDRQ